MCILLLFVRLVIQSFIRIKYQYIERRVVVMAVCAHAVAQVMAVTVDGVV